MVRRFQIERAALDDLDDEVIVQDLAIPIGDEMRFPVGKVWDIFSANSDLSRAQISIAVIGYAIVDVANGGLFQLVMNSSGGLIPDLPAAYREIGREAEAAIFDKVLKLFPGAEVLRDDDARVAFAGSKIVPGGWDGLSAGRKTKLYDDLVALEEPLADHMQSEGFFRAIAAFVEAHPESFEIVGA